MADREEQVYDARLSEQAERYEEMKQHMVNVVNMGVELTTEERNLLSVAFKNIIGSRRASWRVISAIPDEKSEVKRIMKTKIVTELNGICDDMLDLLDKTLIPGAHNDESKVFYLKMKGDYCRYKAEYLEQAARKEAAEQSLVAYKSASDLAISSLRTTDPIRLGLALNFSVFYFEILNSRERACRLAKAAFEDAIKDLETLNEESYKDSTLILQLLRDNLTLWTDDMESHGNDDAEQNNDKGDEIQDVEATDE